MTSVAATTTALPSRAVDAAALAGSTPVAHGLSPFALFLNADFIGKAVILMLVFASIWCWTIIFDKFFRFTALNREANAFEDEVASGKSLEDIANAAGERPAFERDAESLPSRQR